MFTTAKATPISLVINGPIESCRFQKLVIKLIEENPAWGSNRIVGALDNLGYTVSDSIIDNIRRRNGFAPAPVRGKATTWRRFLQAHWDTLIAADFFTTEVLSWSGLVTCYTFFVIELRSRSVHACGTTVSPDAGWMKQAARQLVDSVDGFAIGKSHLIRCEHGAPPERPIGSQWAGSAALINEPRKWAAKTNAVRTVRICFWTKQGSN